MTQLRNDDLWDRITALSAKKSPRFVAVAYLARGASRLLTLDEDDVLVVDMGDASVKTGRTDPQEVLQYLEKGVRVYCVENLHAKAFVLGPHVLVGSANVSAHSRDDLVEAAIESTDAELRAGAVTWIKSLAIAPITPKHAKAKLKLYRPPAWGGGGKPGARAPKRAARPEVGRLWIINVTPAKFSDEEESILDKQATRAKKELQHLPRFEVETIRFHAASRFARVARVGHTVIEIHRNGSTIGVWPPARVVYRGPYTAGGTARVGIHLERRAVDEAWSWQAFKSHADAAGVKVKKMSMREVRDADTHEPLLAFFRSRK